MKKLASILAITLTLLCCCTRNDGDIGPLFGFWQMEEREVEGIDLSELQEPLPPEQELFWVFQSSVIEMKHVISTSRYVSIYGNWELDGKEMRLDFPDSQQPVLEEFLLPRHCTVEVLALDGKTLEIAWRPESGGKVRYKFRKR